MSLVRRQSSAKEMPSMPQKCLVIAGFPGIGKTFLKESLGQHQTILDLDSAQFSKHPNWPNNYVACITSELSKYHVILVSSHEETRNAMRRRNVPFTLVYPKRSLKEEYMERYEKRGSPEGLCTFLDENWDSLVQSCADDQDCGRIVLDAGEYLSDVVPQLKLQGPAAVKSRRRSARLSKWMRRAFSTCCRKS